MFTRRGGQCHYIWDEKFYVCGEGLYHFDNGHWSEEPNQGFFLNKIRGSAENNIFAVGAFGSCMHYNGSTWRSYNNLQISGSLYGLSVTNNCIITVGQINNRAIIIRGKILKKEKPLLKTLLEVYIF